MITLNVGNKLFAIILILFYATLAGLAGAFFNEVLNIGTFTSSELLLLIYLFVLTVIAIICNIGWAFGMLTSPWVYKELAALSAISGLLLLTIASKYRYDGNNFVGKHRVLWAYESFAIIDGALSIIMGAIYVAWPVDKTGYKTSEAPHRSSV